jgi:hypothetical protein
MSMCRIVPIPSAVCSIPVLTMAMASHGVNQLKFVYSLLLLRSEVDPTLRLWESWICTELLKILCTNSSGLSSLILSITCKKKKFWHPNGPPNQSIITGRICGLTCSGHKEPALDILIFSLGKTSFQPIESVLTLLSLSVPKKIMPKKDHMLHSIIGGSCCVD